jgi:transcriptional regulator with XRE-family HTH domain
VDTLQQKFGNMIRRRRLALGLGQEALADKASLHRTHVSLLERGKRMPTLQVVQKLATALETTMASLMAELEGM